MVIKMIIPKSISPTNAIKAKCLDCCCGDRREVRDCTAYTCPLFPYRFGMRPDAYMKKHVNAVLINEKGRKTSEKRIKKANRGDRDEKQV